MLPRDPSACIDMDFRAHTYLLISGAARRGMISGEAALGYREFLTALDALPTERPGTGTNRG